MKATPEQLRAEARRRVDRACALIERAQNDLATACGELSALNHGAPVWRATGKMHDRVKGLWWRVHQFRMGGRYRLDDTNVAGFEARLQTEARNAAAIAAQIAGADPLKASIDRATTDWARDEFGDK
jgi:hypothetical protein